MDETIIVYKSGGEKNDYLITLKIKPSDANFDRSGVVNKNTVKFRCRKAYVVSIIHKDTNESVDIVCSGYDSKFIYKVGFFIEEPAYDFDVNNVCSRGIHFFLTKEPALLFGYLPEKYNGPCKVWYENGQLFKEFEYKNGKLDGPCKVWYENGQLFIECEFKNGVKDGPYKLWYDNGQLDEEFEFKNDKIEGQSKSWYKNGQLFEESVYKNGERLN